MAKQHSTGFLAIVTDAKTRVKECQVPDVKQRIDKGEQSHIVDVREESEYAAGRSETCSDRSFRGRFD